MRISAPTLVDPCKIYDYIEPGNSTTTGKTLASSPVLDGAGVFVWYGQSHVVAVSDGATHYTPTHLGPNILNYNVYDQNFYWFDDPPLGCDANAVGYPSSFVSRLSDKLLDAGKYPRLVHAMVGIGGTYASDWAPYGIHHHRLISAIVGLRKKGLTPTCVIFQQGQADIHTSNPYFGGFTTTAQWEKCVTATYTALNGRGYAGPLMVAQHNTFPYALDSNAANIDAAQSGVLSGTSIIAGPDLTNLTTADVGPGGLHFNNTGLDYVAGLYSTKIQAVL